MYFRYAPQTVKFVNSWLDVINARPDYWDQLAFNDMARAGWDPYVKVGSVVEVGKGGVKMMDLVS